MYFGTTSGEIWASTDEGETWRCIAEHLPEIYSVESPSRAAADEGLAFPTPLRSYTNQQSWVEADGTTIDEVLRDLDRQFAGLRFRVVDEQGRLRRHMKVFLGDEAVRDLDLPVAGVAELTLMQAPRALSAACHGRQRRTRLCVSLAYTRETHKRSSLDVEEAVQADHRADEADQQLPSSTTSPNTSRRSYTSWKPFSTRNDVPPFVLPFMLLNRPRATN